MEKGCEPFVVVDIRAQSSLALCHPTTAIPGRRTPNLPATALSMTPPILRNHHRIVREWSSLKAKIPSPKLFKPHHHLQPQTSPKTLTDCMIWFQLITKKRTTNWRQRSPLAKSQHTGGKHLKQSLRATTASTQLQLRYHLDTGVQNTTLLNQSRWALNSHVFK